MAGESVRLDEKDNLDGFVFAEGMKNMVAILDKEGRITLFTHRSYAVITLHLTRAVCGEPLAYKYVQLQCKGNVHVATLINLKEREKSDDLWRYISPETAPITMIIGIAGIIICVSIDESRIAKEQTDFQMQLFNEWGTVISKSAIQRHVKKKRKTIIIEDDMGLYLF